MSAKKDLRQHLRRLRRQGFTVEQRKGGHYKITPPGGGDGYFTGSTPGFTGLRNAIEDLRSMGYDPDGRKGRKARRKGRPKPEQPAPEPNTPSPEADVGQNVYKGTPGRDERRDRFEMAAAKLMGQVWDEFQIMQAMGYGDPVQAVQRLMRGEETSPRFRRVLALERAVREGFTPEQARRQAPPAHERKSSPRKVPTRTRKEQPRPTPEPPPKAHPKPQPDPPRSPLEDPGTLVHTLDYQLERIRLQGNGLAKALAAVATRLGPLASPNLHELAQSLEKNLRALQLWTEDDGQA